MTSSGNLLEPRRSAFADGEIFGTKVTMAVQRAWDRDGNITVHAKIDGTYDKAGLPDPLILTFYYTLREAKITQLIILLNKTVAE